MAVNLERPSQIYECVCHDEPSCERLEELWQKLPGGALSTPFQTTGFIHVFQRHMLKPSRNKFRIYEFRRRGTTVPLAYLPILIRKRGPVRIASLPDLGVSDQNALVLSKAHEIPQSHANELWRAFLNVIDDADLLDIYNLVPNVAGRPNPLFHLDQAEFENSQIMLDLSTEQSVSAWQAKSVFKEARSKYRKLTAAGAEVFIPQSKEDRAWVCQSLLSQKDIRFSTLGIDNHLSDEAIANLYLDLAEDETQDAPAVLLALRKGEEIISASMVLRSECTVNGVLSSIGDVRWRRMSPGIVLMSKVIDWAQSEGCRRLCFGTGNQQYKQRFGGDVVPTKKVIRAVSHAGNAYRLVRKFKDRTMSDLRRKRSGATGL